MLSVLICARNELHNIKDCVSSVIHLADEVVVIDDFSEDGTDKEAVGLGCRVIQRHMQGDWSSQRNFGLENCKGDWILVLDADERVSEQLASSIKEVLSRDDFKNKSYWIRRENRFHYNKATHGVLRSDKVLRLFPKQGAYYTGLVHEKLHTSGSDGLLKGVLYHYTYDNWDAYFGKFNKYTQLMAKQQYESGKRANFWRDIVLRPWVAFFKMYILKRGFLDGKLGFILSVNHFFYTMTKYVRLYYLDRHDGKL